MENLSLQQERELTKKLRAASSIAEIKEIGSQLGMDFTEELAKQYLETITPEGGGAMTMTKELELAARLSDTTDREEAISLAMELFGMTRERAEAATDEALKMYKKS